MVHSFLAKLDVFTAYLFLNPQHSRLEAHRTVGFPILFPHLLEFLSSACAFSWPKAFFPALSLSAIVPVFQLILSPFFNRFSISFLQSIQQCCSAHVRARLEYAHIYIYMCTIYGLCSAWPCLSILFRFVHCAPIAPDS